MLCVTCKDWSGAPQENHRPETAGFEHCFLSLPSLTHVEMHLVSKPCLISSEIKDQWCCRYLLSLKSACVSSYGSLRRVSQPQINLCSAQFCCCATFIAMNQRCWTMNLKLYVFNNEEKKKKKGKRLIPDDSKFPEETGCGDSLSVPRFVQLPA